MHSSRENKAIAIAVRCYPQRWRSRHGDDALQLAGSLLHDGVPWWSIALNFLGAATRERVIRKPSLRFGTIVAAVTVGVAAGPLALFASLSPAGASNANVAIVISQPNNAARQLAGGFAANHFKLTVTEQRVPTNLDGSILSVYTTGMAKDGHRIISEIQGTCGDGTSGCINGLVVPIHFKGTTHVTIGESTSQNNRDH